MTRFEYDAAALKRPAVWLLATALAGAALLWSSDAWLSARQALLEQTRGSLIDARTRYRQAVEAGAILETAQRRYLQLQHRGFIGDEPRLVWIEALRNSGREHRLYSLQYSLKQRQPLQLGGYEGNEDYQLYGSFMHLDIELAHEVDLLRFFGELERERPALWQLRGCSVSRLALVDGIAFDKANVKASCELAWYTAKPFTNDPEGEQPL